MNTDPSERADAWYAALPPWAPWAGAVVLALLLAWLAFRLVTRIVGRFIGTVVGIIGATVLGSWGHGLVEQARAAGGK